MKLFMVAVLAAGVGLLLSVDGKLKPPPRTAFHDILGKAREVPWQSWKNLEAALNKLEPDLHYSFHTNAEVKKALECWGQKISWREVRDRKYSDGVGARVSIAERMCFHVRGRPSTMYTVRLRFFPENFSALDRFPMTFVAYEFDPRMELLRKNTKPSQWRITANSKRHYRALKDGSMEVELNLQTEFETQDIYFELRTGSSFPVHIVLDDFAVYSPGDGAALQRIGNDLYADPAPRNRFFRKVLLTSHQRLEQGLFSPPGKSRFRFKAPLSPRAVLSFGVQPLSILNRHANQSIVARVSLAIPGQLPHVLFKLRLDPLESREEMQIDLSPFAGSEGDILFESESDPLGPGLFWIQPRIVVNRGNEDKRRNIILISIDSLRPDHLGAYGYARPTSPTIDRLAKNATIFRNAFVAFPTTAKSIASIVASKYFLLSPEHPFPSIFSPEDRTVMEAFQGGGYETGFFGHMEVYNHLRKGFPNCYLGPDVEPDTAAVTSMNQWINWNKSRPFFAWIHFNGPHILTRARKKSMELFPLAGKIKYEQVEAKRGQFCDPECRVPGYREAMIDRYDAKIRSADDLLKLLLAQLETNHLLQNTVIVITADHAENLMDEPYPLWIEHGVLTRSVLNVPLLIVDPARPEQKWVDDLVTLVDLAPTLLDIAGISSPSSFEGKSFRSLQENEPTYSRRFVLFQEECDRGRGSEGIYDGRFAYLRNPYGCKQGYPPDVSVRKEGELYDWIRDPGHRENLIASEPDLTKAFSRVAQKTESETTIFAGPPRPEEGGLDLLEQAGYLAPARR